MMNINFLSGTANELSRKMIGLSWVAVPGLKTQNWLRHGGKCPQAVDSAEAVFIEKNLFFLHSLAAVFVTNFDI